MSPSAKILASLVLAAAGSLVGGCKGKSIGAGPAVPEDPPTFEAVLAIDSKTPLAEEIKAQLERRAENLAFAVKIGKAGPGEVGKLKAYLYAPTKPEARKQLEALCKAANLEFRKVHAQNSTYAHAVAAGDDLVPGYTLFKYKYADDDGNPHEELLLLSKRTPLSGSDIKEAFSDPTRAGNIHVELTPTGGKYMRRLTEPMTKGVDRIAIVLDGEVRSAPVVQDTLSTQFVITGIDGDDERRELAGLLVVPLSAKVTIESLTALPAP